MNEIIQKRIEEAVKRYNARAYSPFDDPYELSKEFKRDCYCFKEGATFALQNQWISVEEALPTLDKKYDFSERYIVRTQNNEIKVMRIFRNIAWCDIYNGRAFIPCESNIVTHWMPIPELKGGRNE